MELNSFFLKHIFIMQPGHPLCVGRLLLIAVISAPSIRYWIIPCSQGALSAGKPANTGKAESTWLWNVGLIDCKDSKKLLEWSYNFIILSSYCKEFKLQVYLEKCILLWLYCNVPWVKIILLFRRTNSDNQTLSPERKVLSGHRDCQILVAWLLWPDRVSVQTSVRDLTYS